jgi:hypothetical protein
LKRNSPGPSDGAEAPVIQAVNSDEETPIAWITVETSRAINQIRARRSRAVCDAIQGENRNTREGNLDEGRRRYVVRPVGQFTDLDQLRQ